MRQIVNNFSAVTTLSEKEYSALIDSKFKLWLEKKFGTSLMIFAVIIILIAVVVIGSSMSAISWILRIVLIFAAVVMFLTKEKIITAMKDFILKNSVKSANNIGTQLNYGFADDNFTIVAGNSHSIEKYSSIIKITESSAHFVIWCSENTGFVVDKNGFTFGEVSEFGKFIAEKTGNEIVTV